MEIEVACQVIHNDNPSLQYHWKISDLVKWHTTSYQTILQKSLGFASMFALHPYLLKIQNTSKIFLFSKQTFKWQHQSRNWMLKPSPQIIIPWSTPPPPPLKQKQTNHKQSLKWPCKAASHMPLYPIIAPPSTLEISFIQTYHDLVD